MTASPPRTTSWNAAMPDQPNIVFIFLDNLG